MANQPTFKKVINVMTTAALTAGVVAPIVAPMEASANSTNLVDKVLYVDNDYTSTTKKVVEGNPEQTPANKNLASNSIIIKEDDVNFSTNDTFRLSLPSGVKWLKDVYQTDNKTVIIKENQEWVVVNKDDQTAVDNISNPAFEVVQVTDSDLELKIVGTWGGEDSVAVPMYFEVDGAEGELKVTVDAKGSTLTAGQYTFAVVSEGKTSTTISEVKTIGDGDKIGTIRIDELALGTMKSEQQQKIVLTLPNKFEWKETDTTPTAKVGNKDLVVDVDDNNKKKLTITIGDDKLVEDKLNTIYIEGLSINADKDAPYGDIEVQVSGDEVTDQDIVVAKYADYSSELSLEEEIPTVLAGRNNVDTDDLETAEILVKEEVVGSWLSNRDMNIEFPSWVKVVGYEISSAKGFDETGGTSGENQLEALFAEAVEGDSHEIELDKLPEAKDNSSKREFKVKFYVSTKADAQGDITAKFSGKAGIEGELVVAKAVSPVNVDFEKANVRTGIKNQAIGDITITEAAKEAFVKNGMVELQLSDGVDFSEEPTVEVIEGNLEIDEDTIEVDNNGKLSFQIDSESTRASKIKILNVKVDLDRSVPEGDVEVEVGGTALVQNADLSGSTDTAFTHTVASIGDKEYTASVQEDGSEVVPTDNFNLKGAIEVGEFDKDYVVKKGIATVVTPAQGNERVGEVKFTVGSTSFVDNGVEKAMDVAPFIEASRTYLPVRYVAKSVGVDGENILWDEATRKVTIIKDARVAQLTIGSNVLTINGANIPMDVKAQIKDGRTVLPLRAVAQALGAQVDWNEADRTVTVK